MLLNFDIPTNVKIDAGFDGGPTGGFVPQMSKADAERWKCKHFNLGKENARIEIRKRWPTNATQLLIIVALDGWDLSSKHEKRSKRTKGPFHTDTRGKNVRMSMNGPMLLTFDDWGEINQIVKEAKIYLEHHNKSN